MVLKNKRYAILLYKRSSSQFGAAETADSEQIGDENYESSLRAGGGYAIAALAAASRYPYPSCEHTGCEYLDAARDSYLYLEQRTTSGTQTTASGTCWMSSAPWRPWWKYTRAPGRWAS